MSVMDDRGRLLGRINIVDLAALILLLAILPLAYGASLLFQPARAQITEVGQVDITNAERRIVAGGSLLSAKLKIKGTGFNPMLRAYIDDSPALAFVYENPNSADVLVGPLTPGAHDLILMDGVQEIARATGAVKIDNPSSRVLRATGWLTNLEPAVADQLKGGTTFPPGAPTHEIAVLGPVRPGRSRIRFGDADADYPIENRVERQAVILLRCDPSGEQLTTGQETCTVGGQSILGAPPVAVVLPGPTASIGFAIDELFPVTPPQRARIQVRVDAGAAVATGDRDALLDDRAATVVSVQGDLVTLDLGLDDSREGRRYRGTLVRVGSRFRWGTERYEATGRVTSLTMTETKK
ncbi:MAG TPA: hypothetical protein VF491_20350 [Vicinamibacterales bacterium]